MFQFQSLGEGCCHSCSVQFPFTLHAPAVRVICHFNLKQAANLSRNHDTIICFVFCVSALWPSLQHITAPISSNRPKPGNEDEIKYKPNKHQHHHQQQQQKRAMKADSCQQEVRQKYVFCPAFQQNWGYLRPESNCHELRQPVLSMWCVACSPFFFLLVVVVLLFKLKLDLCHMSVVRNIYTAMRGKQEPGDVYRCHCLVSREA